MHLDLQGRQNCRHSWHRLTRQLFRSLRLSWVCADSVGYLDLQTSQLSPPSLRIRTQRTVRSVDIHGII